MERLKNIYAIAAGCYSDYRVLAVCDDSETAEQWAKALREDEGVWKSDARVETLPVIPKGDTPRKVVTYHRQIELSDNGNSGGEREWSNEDFIIDLLYGEPTVRPNVRYVRAPCHNNLGGRLEVRGADKTYVDKVFNDRLRMWKAGQYGGPNVPEVVEEEAE